MRNFRNKIDITALQDTLHKNPINTLDTNTILKNPEERHDTTRSIISIETIVTKSRNNSNALLQIKNDQAVSAQSNILPHCATLSSNKESLITNYQGVYWFSNQKNSVCYFIEDNTGKTKRSIFVKDKKDASNDNINIVEIKDRNQNQQNWTFIPLLFGLFTLAFVVTLYRKQLGQIFDKVVSYFVSTKHSKENSIHFQRFAIILDLLFILSFSLLIDRAVQKFGYYSPPLKFEYLVFVIISAFLVLLRIFRWIIFKISGLFSGLNLFFNDLYSNSTLHTRVLSVFLLPSVFLITYTTGFISTFIIYMSISITIIVLIIRIIRIIRVFVDHEFSIFYFILYLCALEISPLLIIWKLVISR